MVLMSIDHGSEMFNKGRIFSDSKASSRFARNSEFGRSGMAVTALATMAAV